MQSTKSSVVCSYCSKIYKEPIFLPCKHSICQEHLKEKEVLKQSRIKCAECKQEFDVKNNKFQLNEPLRESLKSEFYLTSEEIVLKNNLENSTRKFFDIYDEYTQSKSKLESHVFDRFQEIKFQIDLHREDTPKVYDISILTKIDDISLDMIGKIEKNQVLYWKSLNEKLFETQRIKDIEKKSLNSVLNEIEDTFRNPNLLLESIKNMQSKQDKAISDMEFISNELNQVKVHLEASNGFKPNVFLFFNNRSLFGDLFLNVYPNTEPYMSEIINSQQSVELIKLCEFSPNDKWTLLYRGTRDGFGSSDFHSKCDGHSNTLIVLQAQNSSYIFGGFTTVSWESVRADFFGTWKVDPNAFLFSLTNKENKPMKMSINPNQIHYAINCNYKFGPIFGRGRDLLVCSDSNTTSNSHSNLSDTYKHPQYAYRTLEAQEFLAGSNHFRLSEIEVYEKVYFECENS
jgi:hypothetical protein